LFGALQGENGRKQAVNPVLLHFPPQTPVLAGENEGQTVTGEASFAANEASSAKNQASFSKNQAWFPEN